MESIDAYSNSDLVWLLFGYRTVVKASAIIGTYVCYHGFRALREKRIADILSDAAKVTAAAARLAAASPPLRCQDENDDETPHYHRQIVVDDDNDDDDNNHNNDTDQENENRRIAAASSSTRSSASSSQLHHISVNLLASINQPSATTLKDDDDINLVRRVNLGLDPTPQQKQSQEQNENENGNDDEDENSAAPSPPGGVIVAETSIADFPLLTARRSLTSALDFLNPGQIITEGVAILLECVVLLNVTRATLGCIAPDDGDSRYGDITAIRVAAVAASTTTSTSSSSSTSSSLLSSSSSSSVPRPLLRSWEIRDDQSHFTFNWSIVRRWARRFIAAPPVALRKVFGELKEGESFKTVESGSLVAKSLLAGILYRDAVGVAALPFPMWFGCLVTPMCVRFAFVESDLQNHMDWKDIRSIAFASAIRSLCHSVASVFQENWVNFWRARRIRNTEKQIAVLQQELHVFDATDEYIVPSQELTGEQQREKVTLGSARRSGVLESGCCSDKFLPANLFSGFLLSDSTQTQVIAAASNALWAFSADLIGFSAMLFLRRYTFFKATSFRAQIAIACARMVCQAATLTALRVMATKLTTLNFFSTLTSTNDIKNSSGTNGQIVANNNNNNHLNSSSRSSASHKSKKNSQQQSQQHHLQQAQSPSPTFSPSTVTISTSTTATATATITAAAAAATSNGNNNGNNSAIPINELIPPESPSTMSLFAPLHSLPQMTAATAASSNATTKRQCASPASTGNVNNDANEQQDVEKTVLFVNPLRKTIQSRIGTTVAKQQQHQQQQHQQHQQQQQQQSSSSSTSTHPSSLSTGLFPLPPPPSFPAFPSATTTSTSTAATMTMTKPTTTVLTAMALSSPPVSPQIEVTMMTASGTTPASSSIATGGGGRNGRNVQLSASMFPTSPALQSANNIHNQGTPSLSGLASNISNNNNNNNSWGSVEQQQRRRQVLSDLDKAFGSSSALVISHISDAVHSMLPALTPDNNVRLHALLYLNAVDEYVAAVGTGELRRNFAKIYSVRSTLSTAPTSTTFTTTSTAASNSGASSATSESLVHQHHHHHQQQHHHHHHHQQSLSTSLSASPAALSIIAPSATPPITTTTVSAASASASASSSSPYSCCYVYNILEQKHIHIPTHTFTAEEIADRKALAANSGGATKPFYCVACKYTFRDGYRALVLPCGHLVHDSCGTRLRSDWCPRCVRPFEKPTSSDHTILQFHEAHSKLKALAATWNKHVLLPPHLWFSEWRRVRQHVIHKCDEDRLKQELKLLQCEKIRFMMAGQAPSSAPRDNNKNVSNGTTATSSPATLTGGQQPLFTLPSSLVQSVPTEENVVSGSPPLAVRTTNNNNKNNNDKRWNPKNANNNYLVNLLPTTTWAQHLVETQVVFAVPDDFSPSGYGLSDVPIMAALNALGVLAVNRTHERTVAMIHETMVDGKNGSNSMTSGSRVVSFGGIRC